MTRLLDCHSSVLCLVLVCLIAGCLLTGSTALAGPGRLARAGDVHAPSSTDGSEGFSDEAVEAAIKKAQQFLLNAQRDDGSWEKRKTNNYAYPVAPSAIVTYALLESGLSPINNDKMKKAMAFLAKTETENTYCYAFRSLALASAARSNERFRAPCRKDVNTIYRSFHRPTGGYSYWCRGRPATDKEMAGFAGGPDASNAQYALLGVWAGSRRAGAEVPRQYWQLMLKYWLNTQRPDGGWGYAPKLRQKSYMAMTLAGVASLYVCTDELYTQRYIACKGNAEIKPISNGLDWVNDNFAKMLKQDKWFYYTLYGLERVALASGHKYFGEKDWYKLGAAELLRRQERDGSFKSGGNHDGGATGRTSYALLFLVRGRRPVLLNKLQFDGDWNNRPRDAATVTRWLREKFEAQWTWQTIPVTIPVSEWHDAPILYISGSRAPQFTDEQIEKLRTFVHQGGTIFSATECHGGGFKTGIRKVYAKMFPDYELTPCGPKHPVYSSHYDLRGRPKLFELSNGIRPLVIHTDEDLPKDWQLHRSKSPAFEAMANITLYVTPAKREFRARGVSPWPKETRYKPRATVNVVRLKHNARYNPEPLAWKRFALMLGNRQHVKLKVTEPIDITDLGKHEAKLAAITGMGTLKLTDAQKSALKAFVADGGTLIVDAAGGNEAFATSARKELDPLLDGTWMNALSTGPILGRKNATIEKVAYREGARGVGRSGRPRLRALYANGKPRILLSDVDLTAGLVGYPFQKFEGIEPDGAYRVMRNVVLHAADLDAIETTRGN